MDKWVTFLTLLSNAIFAPILPTEPEDHDQTIHRVPGNRLIRLFTYV